MSFPGRGRSRSRARGIRAGLGRAESTSTVESISEEVSQLSISEQESKPREYKPEERREHRSEERREHRSEERREHRSEERREHRLEERREHRSEERREHRQEGRREYRPEERREHRAEERREYRPEERREYRPEERREYRPEERREYRPEERREYRPEERREHRLEERKEYRPEERGGYRLKERGEYRPEERREYRPEERREYRQKEQWGESKSGSRRYEGTKSTDIEVIDSRNYAESTSYEIIRKSDVAPGTEGRSVELISNFFKINVKPLVVYQHNIEFTFKNKEDKDKYPDNELLQKFFAKYNSQLFETYITKHSDSFTNYRFLYDGGKCIYATHNIVLANHLRREFDCQIGLRMVPFFCELKMVQVIDLSLIADYYESCNTIPEVIIHFIELVFQKLYSHKFLVFKGRMFNADQPVRGPKDWLSFAPGFSDAIRLTEIGPTLNMHLKTSCIISPGVDTLLQLVIKLSKNNVPSRLSSDELTFINRIIKGLKIFTVHTGRKMLYTIKGLWDKPKECFFELKTNGNGHEERVNVHEYFLNKYKLELHDYPTVKVQGRKELLLPLEVCNLVEKQFLNNSKIDSETQNDLLRVSTYKPIIFINKITSYAKSALNLDNEFLDTFGTSIEPKPIRFYGRTLDAPRQKGAGRNERFAYCISKPAWAFFSFDRNFHDGDISRMVVDIQRSANRYGLDMRNCFVQKQVIIDNSNLQEMLNIFGNIRLQVPNCKLVFIALPQVHNIYSMVKHFGDQKFGLITQCINTIKAKHRKPSYIDNILLKVNGKLGGKNSVIEENILEQLPFNHKQTIILGIDVNHPTQGERVESSIAVVVGSYDHQFTMYTASIRVQKKNRDEMINCLEEMVTELLNEYRNFNGYFPENIFVFRDGISEGQFTYAEVEIKQIRAGIRKSVKNGKLVYIVTQKNHQTRFVLSKPTGSADRPIYNVPSGTIVDNTIVEPSHYMFYINSHFSQLGTSKPLKYIVLHNDFELRQVSNDDLQKFCFYCCFNCTRFRGPIALPVPVRYADLCAYRSKLHLESQHEYFRKTDAGDPVEFERKFIEKLNEVVKVNDQIKNFLYYC